jgi:hypothetical protein
MVIICLQRCVANSHSASPSGPSKVAVQDKGKEKVGDKRPATEPEELTPFSFYCSVMKEDIKAENPDATDDSLQRILASQWQKLNKTQRRNYEAIVTQKNKRRTKE